MKTKNNVQKAVLRFAAVVISFVLISYTVSAQDFWKRFLENSSFGHIAMAMVDSGEATEASAENAAGVEFFYETEMETRLEMESWMTSESNFAVSAFHVEELSDKSMELEYWMLDQNLFQTSVETESALQLEEWMVSTDVWNI
ncbi:hypothetical protein [Maribellus sediminis]|uniref:hypothetical protein n=1 Tax=Maribellus sediminis TaxID=2696285 RepID=UPI001430215C|nr:hypothetical protein [Maribellus sediminis]